LSLDSDEKRLLIVLMPIFAKASELGIISDKGRKLKARDLQNASCFSIMSVPVANFRKKRFSDWQRVRMQIRLAQHSQFMKLSLSLAVLTAFFISSCSEEPPPRPARHRVASYPPTGTAEYPPSQQPFNPNGPVQPQAAPREESAASPVPTAAPPTKVAKGDYPYGIPVPGKPHLVESPFSPGKYVDVEGFPPGTEVKDPYTDKIFLVP